MKAAIEKLEEGMALEKCRKCNCMRGTLEYLLSSHFTKDDPDLKQKVEGGLKQMKKIEYDCLGCEPCIPWQAMEELRRT